MDFLDIDIFYIWYRLICKIIIDCFYDLLIFFNQGNKLGMMVF